MSFTSQPLSYLARLAAFLALTITAGFAGDAAAQAVDVQHWQGTTAVTRQPEQVIAGTMAEWRSLWSRVGVTAPDLFEPGRTEAVGIFLGGRSSDGYAVNIVSAARRRDRIMIVFEERAPSNVMTAQTVPSTRTVSSVPGGGAGFVSNGSATASLPPIPYRPAGPPTSPWAILLLNRADLPITVEQRLFLH